MKGIRRVLAVTAVAIACFVVAVIVLGDEARAGCVTAAPPDDRYDAEIVGEVSTSGTDYRVEITKDGERLEGADVCLNVAMVGMLGMGASDDMEEVAPGLYEMSIIFEMTGRWEADILVREGNLDPISIPLEFSVE